MEGIFIPGLTKEEFLATISNTVEVATKKAFNRLNDDKLFTQEEASKFMKVSKSTLIQWAKNGTISPIKLGGRVFYKKSSLLNIAD